MQKPKIISVTYALIITNELIKAILKQDTKAWVISTGKKTLKEKLTERNEIREVSYFDWQVKPGDNKGDRLLITILSDSVTHPDKNQKYWLGIADEITAHIEGDKNDGVNNI